MVIAAWAVGCFVGKGALEARVDGDGDGAMGSTWGGPDCDDADAAVGPDAEEVAGNGVDEDCDGLLGCFEDGDGDGVGAAVIEAGGCDVAVPAGDCDDGSAAVNPDAEEVAGGGDEDCDGQLLCYRDGDGDGAVGTAAATPVSAGATCAAQGLGDEALDCDDADDGVYPGATEDLTDTVDQDCDGDRDGDGLDDDEEAALGTDPLDPDTDHDSLADDVDPGPTTEDTDGDGVCDGPRTVLADTCTSVWFVKEGAAGAGTSWADAKGSVADALAAADGALGHEVWVFEGTYEALDLVVDGVALRGGFDDPSSVDPAARGGETVLDADHTAGSRVAAARGGAVLDRLTLVGGRLDGIGPGNEGGCLLVEEDESATLQDLVVRDCQGFLGGGVAAMGETSLARVAIEDGRAAVQGGGLWAPAPVTLDGCRVLRGDAPDGSLAWFGGPATVQGSAFRDGTGAGAAIAAVQQGPVGSDFRMVASDLAGSTGAGFSLGVTSTLASVAISDVSGVVFDADGDVTVALSSFSAAAGGVTGSGAVGITDSLAWQSAGLPLDGASCVAAADPFVVGGPGPEEGRLYLADDVTLATACPGGFLATDPDGAFAPFAPSPWSVSTTWIRSRETDPAGHLGAHFPVVP